ncbi:hypothetical protein [Rachiplusia nu nucleopolyhedrovirus]|uniref:Uncharacterized protein n=1 Tax=Rachiplusia nu nucleopolyhedrovirus TaxID=2605775 RepID=A0AAF1DB50_9ABAC|nr:hypothetical protein QKQ55_gp041 [Rachiplusia nu nucleopolyhedrovirus]QEI03659.1 hypothetical protein [Rachiplusia nu nucleopolyhedrovirus]
MELIKPFIRYSRLYRITVDEQEKSEIFNQWTRAVGDQSNHQLLSSSELATCEFCYTKQHTKSSQFCGKCFFPLSLEKNIGQELSTYSIISVCFYEQLLDEQENYTDITCSTNRLVWQERLRFTWCMYESTSKLYKIDLLQCIQCCAAVHCKQYNLREVYYSSFSFNLFCKYCLFPLFKILSAAG